MRVALAGWKAQKVARYLAAVLFVVGGIVLAGVFYLAAVVFSFWGAGPTDADRLLQLGCIAGGCVAAAVVLWPVFGERGPELILDERFVRLHHPDLVADMVIERLEISAIHASHTGGGAHAFDLSLGLNSFDGTNFEMAFTTPQRIPRARLSSQLSPLPFATVGRARHVRGLRLTVQDVDWARQVFGTMPQYRALSDEDRAAAGLNRRRGNQALGVAIIVVAITVNVLRHWVF